MHLKDKKLFLLDMDGTIYLGDNLFDCTCEFLNQIKRNGGRYLFLTNNSSKSVDAYVDKLKRLGIDAGFEDFLTSAQVTADYLKMKYGNKLLYVFGTESLKEEFVKNGLNITDEYDESISALVMGFDTELTFKKLEDASKLLLLDIDYIATNPDLVCPTEYGYVPDCGSVSIMLENATGRRPKFIGKPEPEMVTIALKRMGASREETVMIGDRIYTDVASGINAGVDSILVLSGETTLEMAKNSIVKPTYIFPHIKDIYKIIKGEC